MKARDEHLVDVLFFLLWDLLHRHAQLFLNLKDLALLNNWIDILLFLGCGFFLLFFLYAFLFVVRYGFLMHMGLVYDLDVIVVIDAELKALLLGLFGLLLLLRLI